MRLNQIGQMLKLARVPHSKTVERMYPNPAVEIYVPAAKFLVILEVVAKVKMPHEQIAVMLLDRATHRDVKDGEHVYVKVQGDNACNYGGVANPAHPVEQRRMRRVIQKRMNLNVVVECASVVAL